MLVLLFESETKLPLLHLSILEFWKEYGYGMLACRAGVPVEFGWKLTMWKIEEGVGEERKECLPAVLENLKNPLIRYAGVTIMAQTFGQSGSATEVEFHFCCKHTHVKTSRLSKLVKNWIVDMLLNENCRFCGCSLKVKYGSYISSENLFRAVKRSECLWSNFIRCVCSNWHQTHSKQWTALRALLQSLCKESQKLGTVTCIHP